MPIARMLPALGSKSTPLLPNLAHTKKLLGLTSGFALMLQELSVALEIDLPISRATLYKLNDSENIQSVSSKSRDKVTEFFQQAMSASNSLELGLPNEDEYTGGAAETGWTGMVAAFKCNQNSLSEWSYLIDFIEARINLERTILNKTSLANLPKHCMFDDYIAQLKSQTLITDRALQTAQSVLHKLPNSYSEEDLALWHCSSKMDFYFSAAALLELGWLNRIRQLSPAMVDRKPSWFKRGIISSLIQPLVIENSRVELKDSFELFLKWLADDIGTSPFKSRITLYELASYIPIENSNETINGYDLAEKQLDLLKDWRKGKLPSYNKFRGFIKNLRSERQSSVEVDFLTHIGVAVMAMDRLFLEIFEDLQPFQSIQCFEAFNRSVDRYPSYYVHFKAIYSE
ncbi:hypothetical protein CWE08_07395 [Aliidiomarina iranensis]|uniref:Uncharacterized protein n=1 Tax=Aliidiomarina iranensis TaxID=1434071 RepID=A0A432VWF5_9GAMM|nr:hypothetical protein [Aliidiomarina iranensis]RUO20917.1 hypothetical protein CWE08_07395 [Aliidiomarina iranensis]